MLDENATNYILVNTLFLVIHWYLEHSSLCLHSAAVACRGRDGFLFLGNSGAGKTTTATLSASVGHSVLGDDLNLVICDAKAGYLLAAIPSLYPSSVDYSMLRPPLRGIFRLVQDTRDHLVPLLQQQTARILLDGFNQVPKTNALSDDIYGMAFHTISNIARTVPGYELHFRKSPNFWDLIDAEFPD
jgi:hypothetical protein